MVERRVVPTPASSTVQIDREKNEEDGDHEHQAQNVDEVDHGTITNGQRRGR